MPLIYVTGISGVGKSAVRKELLRRGYEAHDTDENDITSWVHRETGLPAEWPEIPTERTAAWYDANDWKISRPRVEQLAVGASERLVFLCGAASNNNEVLGLFDRVVCLTVDEEILLHRLETREGNPFGKSAVERAKILSLHQSSEEGHRRFGAVMLDASAH